MNLITSTTDSTAPARAYCSVVPPALGPDLAQRSDPLTIVLLSASILSGLVVSPLPLWPIFAAALGARLATLKSHRRESSLAIPALILYLTTVFAALVNRVFPVSAVVSDSQLVKLMLGGGLLCILLFRPPHFSKRDLRLLSHVLAGAIVLSFVQLLASAEALGLVAQSLSGSINSRQAYAIQRAGFIIGSPNKNIFSSKLALILAEFLLISTYRWWSKLVVVFLGVFALLLSFSRTGQIAGLAAVSVYLLQGRQTTLVRNITKSRIRTVFWATTLALAAYFYLTRIFRFSYSSSDGFYTRVQLWRTAVNERAQLLFGFGPGSAPDFVDGSADNFHNVLLNQFNDSGLLGAATYVIIWLGVLRLATRHRDLYKPWCVIVPLVMVASVQYTGYDADLVLAALIVVGAAPWLPTRRFRTLNQPITGKEPVCDKVVTSAHQAG